MFDLVGWCCVDNALLNVLASKAGSSFETFAKLVHETDDELESTPKVSVQKAEHESKRPSQLNGN